MLTGRAVTVRKVLKVVEILISHLWTLYIKVPPTYFLPLLFKYVGLSKFRSLYLSSRWSVVNRQ